MNNSFKQLLHSTMAVAGLSKHSKDAIHSRAARADRKELAQAPDDRKSKTTGSQRRAYNRARHEGAGGIGKHFVSSKRHPVRERQVGLKRLFKKDGTFSRWGLLMERYRVTEMLHATKGWRQRTDISRTFVR